MPRASVPNSPAEAARVAKDTAYSIEILRKWISEALQVRAGRSRDAVEPAAAEWVELEAHLADATQQILSLQLQVQSAGSEPAFDDPLVILRYSVARRAFASDAEMASELGVHRSQITRWKNGNPPDSANAQRLVELDVVVSLLRGFLEPESIPKWLRGVNEHLGSRRPLDVLREDRLSEVIRAIEAERAGAFA